ncbi:MAG TPA: EAL domain-containing protein [Candidatus Sulfotelmatobacter sp.]|nr:EAL domain-containing protein [Candidatus Sulfotelmatobacter sp.]
MAFHAEAKLALLDRTGLVLDLNPSLQRLLGRAPLAVRRSLICDEAGRESDILKPLTEGTQTKMTLERNLLSGSGHDLQLEIRLWTIPDEPGYLLAEIRDADNRLGYNTALRQAEDRFRSIFENAIEGIFQTTEDGHYLAANPALARIYGYESPEQLMAGLTNIASQLYVDPTRRDEFLRVLAEDDQVQNFESQVYRRDGSIIWISESCRAVRNMEGELLYFEGLVEDITSRKTAEEQLIHDALHDSLTGLPNRTLLLDRLDQAMRRGGRKDATFAVLFIDCDRFKLINDSLGHLAGDQVLIEMSRRINQCLRASDTLARLGGDEFVVLTEDLDDRQAAILVAERIRSVLAQPFQLEGREYFFSTSVGIAYAAQDYRDAGEILRDADTAMYAAKSQGRDRHMVFERGMHLSAVSQLQVANDLRRAIERDELSVHYQPIVDLAGRRIAGFEALVRWRQANGEMMPPDRFIPIAEETGLIDPLGRFVLLTACRQMAEWIAACPQAENLFISVNLSPIQLHRHDIVNQVVGTVRQSGLSAGNVRLEITESGIMKNPAAAKTKLDALKSSGFKLAIDDFGTGYSSLAHLHRFPIDTLKIDRSFVLAMLNGGEHLEIVRTIIMLAHTLKMSVVAEGVETIAHDGVLRALACNYGQGWLFAKAMSAEEAADQLTRSWPADFAQEGI